MIKKNNTFFISSEWYLHKSYNIKPPVLFRSDPLRPADPPPSPTRKKITAKIMNAQEVLSRTWMHMPHMYLHMYLCMPRTHTHIHTHMHTHIHHTRQWTNSLSFQLHICMYVHVYIQICMYTCIRIYGGRLFSHVSSS